MSKILLIGQVSKHTNSSPSTIRNWVEWGFIEELDRLPVGGGKYEYRTFDPEVVDIINRALELKTKEGMMIRQAFARATKEISRKEE